MTIATAKRAGWVTVVGGVVALAVGTAASAEPPADVHPLADRCALFRSNAVEDASVEGCLRCHDGSFASAGSNHPVGMAYAPAAAARQRSMMPLRSAEEVVARGVFLPDGELRCVTCHDGRSRWRYGLAIPAGASPHAAVNPRDPRTYGPGAAARNAEVGAAQRRGTYGVKVSPKPLCVACHALD
jgi:hypothetical protein